MLELACGNGLWTRFLAPRAATLVAVDSSNRMIERNREWVGDSAVRYVQADLFAWDQPERFDLIFAGFFLSHVPPARWNDFWRKVAGWLAPEGVLAFVDDGGGRTVLDRETACPAGPTTRTSAGSTTRSSRS